MPNDNDNTLRSYKVQWCNGDETWEDAVYIEKDAPGSVEAYWDRIQTRDEETKVGFFEAEEDLAHQYAIPNEKPPKTASVIDEMEDLSYDSASLGSLLGIHGDASKKDLFDLLKRNQSRILQLLQQQDQLIERLCGGA